MYIKFKEVKMHNFLSIGDAAVKLDDRGYCLVKGINHFINDSATSNGAGKSSIWSAICYAITGETIQGLKSNIVNLFGNPDGCFVELLFTVDEKEYKITRYRDYAKIGTDLKIFINGEDKSGKGLRESQTLLEEYLPDITSQLLGSVIILGQGLPQKFSSNSPVARKELLEKLSKSDFMIADIKDRLAKREDIINKHIRQNEDVLLVTNTQIESTKRLLSQTEAEQIELQTAKNFEALIKEIQDQIDPINTQLLLNQADASMIEKEIEKNSQAKYEILSIQTKEKEKINQNFDKERTILNEKIFGLKSKINTCSNEITKLKSIKDICPTCGQKLPDVVKPDTSELEAFKITTEKELAEIMNEKMQKEQENQKEIKILEESYSAKLTDLIKNITQTQQSLNTKKIEIKNLESQIQTLNGQISKLETEQKLRQTRKDIIEKNIIKYKNDLMLLHETIKKNETEKTELLDKKSILDKINTLVKRDFRSFLLIDIIKFIANRAKFYCKYVFDTELIELEAVGTNINISYAQKAYENLSGGEKQKVDLIIQFAIRDMMAQYLNFSSNLLVLDEILDNLDQAGVEKILNLIATKLNDVESIFFISHRADELSIPNDSELFIIKDESGVSRIKDIYAVQ